MHNARPGRSSRWISRRKRIAIYLRDEETEGHSRRVTDLTVELAERIGIPDADLPHVRRGALLHDIGKMGIPDEILLKRGPLTETEFSLMKQHPIYAYELLSPLVGAAGDLDHDAAVDQRLRFAGNPVEQQV